ncbi:PQQ-dependent sugar dehydrogenase [Blastococcus tunisiensis]|uniref:Glucose/arabinose dehydrogenase, beta-propeller fold n=1 Tax=Blastococcus tunisiensis TaxID=1798228 RepID=A0A1I1VXZ3_9ACTN|nr:PQQ-dependent sugar dehydrogenase [Blastococcus sp. DSM 46838]SFD87764.1 Glucose/arabinose dehydrogenase, beta-propeller fold [Blastococcus sp. DSM 46838]
MRASRPVLLATTVLLAACSAEPTASGPTAPTSSAPSGAPSLEVEVVADGLDHPWDVVQAPDGTLLVDERAGGLTAVLPDGTVQEVRADFDDLFAVGETGLMGLALDPDFAENRRLYSCQGVTDGPSIEVTAWTVAEDWGSATRVDDPLIGGIPVNEDSGRHGGCRVEFAPDGALLIGTGDNAVGSNPQDLGSLAGKVLRADPATGDPLPDNPFPDDDGAEDLIWTYGHRNVQGLAVRPDTGQVFSVEHGPDVDDEVNLLDPGANYGWDPAGSGRYDESVPMTDPDLPGAVPAVWSSGDPTIAPSGGTFLEGEEWGAYDGLLLLGVQKDTGVLALRLDEAGQLVEQFRVPELEDDYGRIRTPQLGSDGALYVTTDNGDGDDVVLRVTPTG